MYNAEDFSLAAAFANLASSFYGLEKLIITVSYVIGLMLIVRGVMMYRIFANQTYGSAQRGEIAGPLVFLVVGIILLYFPSSLNTSLYTFFGTSEIGQLQELAAYSNRSQSETFLQLQNIVVKYLKLIGLIAFVRGWVILAKMGHPGAQPGSIGKGITHIIGGVVLINIIDVLIIFENTFGYVG